MREDRKEKKAQIWLYRDQMFPASALAQPWMVQVARANWLRNRSASALGLLVLKDFKWLDRAWRV